MFSIVMLLLYNVVLMYVAILCVLSMRGTLISLFCRPKVVKNVYMEVPPIPSKIDNSEGLEFRSNRQLYEAVILNY